MIIRVTLKDPDGFYDAVQEAVKTSLANTELSTKEKELVLDKRMEDTFDLLKTWVTYGEYVTLLFDTTAKTATVVTVK